MRQKKIKTTKIITITAAPGKTIGVKSKEKNTSLLGNNIQAFITSLLNKEKMQNALLVQ